MKTYGERLAEALEVAQMDRRTLAKAIGLSVQAIGQVILGHTKALTAENSAAAARALGVDPIWLATGEGEMRRGGAAVAEPHAGYEITTWDQPEDLPPDDGRVWIDRYDLQCSAGSGMLQWEVTQRRALPFTTDFFRSVGSKPDDCKLAKARGNSMEPLLFDRDMIMIDTSRTTVRDGGIYVVQLEGEALVKQLFKQPGGGLTLHSFNGSYPDRTVPPHDGGDFRVVGEVIYRSGGGWIGGR